MSTEDAILAAETAAAQLVERLSYVGSNVSAFTSLTLDPHVAAGVQKLRGAAAHLVNVATMAGTLVGGDWPSTARSQAEEIRQAVNDYLDLVDEMPTASAAPLSEASLNGRRAAARESVQEQVSHFRHVFVISMREAAKARLAEAARAEQLAHESPRQAPESVVNILMNVLQFYQFNVTINAGTAFDDSIRAAASRVQDDEARQELLQLSTELKAALVAGNRSQAREVLARLGQWCETNQGKAAAVLGVVGVLLTILQMLLA